MEREDIIKQLEDQIKKRQGIIDVLSKNTNPCWNCGLTIVQIEYLTDWIKDWRNP